ncbi:tail fiber assembly protein [Collimonas pratensis]|uniref:Caudovirales tail fiber assembly family protein n=1 Tax=Collimonas pratensis TaxID=279113 RepID=A0ABN4MDS5_9BURK|nr:tail fiber assembly protein [Collimonas pratensis]AMP13687.1 caudovirales tail fiber assembly family protein [Collimonas pratensis]
MKFSPTTGCFYPDDIQYTSRPDDLIDISQQDFYLAMARQSCETFSVINGNVVVKPLPPPPPLTDAQLIDEATAKRDELLANAADSVAPLQDAVDLAIATSAETALLKSWKQYRVDVNRVQNQAEYPHVINWPVPPAA